MICGSRERKFGGTEQYFGDLMVDECQQFITRNKKEPFFIYWAINWPHYPLQATNKWRLKFKDLPHPRDKYAAFMSTTDELIGRVLDHLEKAGLRENTIFIFQSDHGHSVEERTLEEEEVPDPFGGTKEICSREESKCLRWYRGQMEFLREKQGTNL